MSPGDKGCGMKNKGQGHIECLLLICVMVGVLIAMQVYIKRGIQGRMRLSAEQVSSDAVYSPGATVASSLLTKSVTESSRSFAEPIDPDNPGSDDKRYITETEVGINQQAARQDEVLPFGLEPRRYSDEVKQSE